MKLVFEENDDYNIEVKIILFGSESVKIVERKRTMRPVGNEAS